MRSEHSMGRLEVSFNWLHRQHDAAAFLAVGAQNDAVEALELLAAAAQQEMRSVAQWTHDLRGAAWHGDNSAARGLALIVAEPSREGGVRAGVGRLIIASAQIPNSTLSAPLQPPNGAPIAQIHNSATSATIAGGGARDSTTPVCAEGSVDGDTKLAATCFSNGHDELTVSALSAGGDEHCGNADDGYGSENSSVGRGRPANAARPRPIGPPRLPLQGLQAHELVCGRCGTARHTQLAPFYVLPLGASAYDKASQAGRSGMRLAPASVLPPVSRHSSPCSVDGSDDRRLAMAPLP